MLLKRRFWGSVAFCLLLLASLVLVAAWQNGGARFNQLLVSANAEIGRSDYVLGSTLQRSIQSEEPDLDDIRQAFEAHRSVFSAVSQRTSQFEVPDLPLAQELHAAHQKFLAGQQTLIEADLREMVTVMEDAALSKEQRSLKLKGIAKRIREQHEADFAAFESVQRSFAEKNGFPFR